MAAISAPANQRPKGLTLGASSWGQTGPWQEGKAGWEGRRSPCPHPLPLLGPHKLPAPHEATGTGDPHISSQATYPALPHPYSHIPAPPAGRGQDGGASLPAIPWHGAFVPAVPPPSYPESYLTIVSPVGHTPKSRHGEPSTCQLYLEPSSVFCHP